MDSPRSLLLQNSTAISSDKNLDAGATRYRTEAMAAHGAAGTAEMVTVAPFEKCNSITYSAAVKYTSVAAC